MKKQLAPLHVWAIAFGCIIGFGAFINPGKMYLPNSGVAGTAVAMILGALVMIVIANNYAYMVPKYPKAGGEVTFTMECFGREAAYLCGWFLIVAYLSLVPANATALSLIVDGVDGTADILKFGFHYTVAGYDVYMGEMLLAAAVIVLFAIINIKGVKIAGVIQTIFCSLLWISVLILVVSALTSDKAAMANLTPWWGFEQSAAKEVVRAGEFISINQFAHTGAISILESILATLVIAPFAYVGFDTIPQVAEEFNFPHKKVTFIMIVAIMMGCAVYIANNTIAAAALENWPELIINSESTPWLLLAATEGLLGLPGKIFVSVAVLCACCSGVMGFYLAASRLINFMSREQYLPHFLSVMDDKHGTPKGAILFCMTVSFCGPLLGREALGWFVDMTSIGASIAFGFTSIASYKTAKRCGDASKLLRFTSILGGAFSILFMALQLIPIPGLESVHFGKESYIMFIVWIGIGLVYYFSRKKTAGGS